MDMIIADSNCDYTAALAVRLLNHLASSDVWPGCWRTIPILPPDSSCPPSEDPVNNCYRLFDPVSRLISRMEPLCPDSYVAAGQLLAILPAGCQICEQELPAVPAAMSAHAGALRPGGGS
jgi:hypothetical protein